MTIREDEFRVGCLRTIRDGGNEFFQLARCFRKPCCLVISEREIETDRVVAGVDDEGAFVLLDRVLVTAERRVSRTEIRSHIDARRMSRKNRHIPAHRTLQISRLVQLRRPLESPLDGGILSQHTAPNQQQNNYKTAKAICCHL